VSPLRMATSARCRNHDFLSESAILIEVYQVSNSDHSATLRPVLMLC
jgi:hypothetical protein